MIHIKENDACFDQTIFGPGSSDVCNCQSIPRFKPLSAMDFLCSFSIKKIEVFVKLASFKPLPVRKNGKLTTTEIKPVDQGLVFEEVVIFDQIIYDHIH